MQVTSIRIHGRSYTWFGVTAGLLLVITHLSIITVLSVLIEFCIGGELPYSDMVVSPETSLYGVVALTCLLSAAYVVWLVRRRPRPAPGVSPVLQKVEPERKRATISYHWKLQSKPRKWPDAYKYMLTVGTNSRSMVISFAQWVQITTQQYVVWQRKVKPYVTRFDAWLERRTKQHVIPPLRRAIQRCKSWLSRSELLRLTLDIVREGSKIRRL